jgi:hypothetical protein
MAKLSSYGNIQMNETYRIREERWPGQSTLFYAEILAFESSHPDATPTWEDIGPERAILTTIAQARSYIMADIESRKPRPNPETIIHPYP